jgi:hypothetical protein
MRKGAASVLNFLRTGRLPDDPRDLLAQIAAQYPDRERCLRIFVAAVLDNQHYVRACIEHAFETWTSRTNQ